MEQAYQRIRVLRLHSLGYADHLDGGRGRTAEESVSTPSTASVSVLAGDSLADSEGLSTSGQSVFADLCDSRCARKVRCLQVR